MLAEMSVPMALLGLLDREPSHGYELKRDYDTFFGGGRQLPFGQVYATLARFARDGKALVGEAEPGAGPDRKRYTITEMGKHEVEVWLAEPIPPEPYLQTDLFVKVVLSLMLGRPAEEYLDAQRAAHLRRMRELTGLKQQGNLVDGFLAVMGPSGSGKSTLLYCLAGILVPDLGEVSFESQRLDKMREGERSRLRRDRFGFVFQFGQLVPELTAEENVALPLLLGGTPREEALGAARGWFERLDLKGMERHRTGEMSGGQSQRVALARGLVAHPSVLFADEPTGSLDSLNGELVMELMTAAARAEGTTIVLVTHEPRVAAYADREVIVRDGKVAAMEGALR
jgi:putative ABC transport system ATP-binding protein